MHRKYLTRVNSTKSSLIITLAVVGVFLFGGVVSANFESQIRELNQQNQQNRSAQSSLEDEATSLEDLLAGLRQKINSIQIQIGQNESKQADVQQQIEEARAEIQAARELLGQNIKEMYFADKISTVEMLATSNNLSEFVDKQAYREAVSDKINTNLQTIEELSKKLDEQKVALDKLIEDQKGMQSQLVSERSENDRLLALNNQQRSDYDKKIESNSKKIAELRRQQAIENQRNIIGSVSNVSPSQYAGTGSYPWANAPFPNYIPDPWGMYQRQCVSYTAWKVASTGRHMPYWGGRGNANLWPSNARAAGIPVSTTPKAGTVAVSMAGYYGHTMYVEEVHSDGTITVSDYNQKWDGRYSVYRRTTAGLQFIYF